MLIVFHSNQIEFTVVSFLQLRKRTWSKHRSQWSPLIHPDNSYRTIYAVIRSNSSNPFLARWNISFLTGGSFFIVDAFLPRDRRRKPSCHRLLGHRGSGRRHRVELSNFCQRAAFTGFALTVVRRETEDDGHVKARSTRRWTSRSTLFELRPRDEWLRNFFALLAYFAWQRY